MTWMNRIKGALLCTPIVAAIALTPMASHAQDGGRIDWEATLEYNLLLTSSTGVVALWSVLNPVFSTTSSTSSITDTLLGDIVMVEEYMEDNAVAMAHDISMGGGTTVEDLAAMAGLEPSEHAAFARALRSKRVELVELLDPETIDTRAATEFASIVESALLESDELRGAVERRRPNVM